MRVLAIDFGTSNTVAVTRTPDGRMRPLLFDGAPLLPSAVYLDADGRMLVGRDAMHSARLDPSRFEPNPKRRIDDGHIFLGDAEVAVPQLFSHVLSQVLAEARRQLGGAPGEVRLTHPARWGERRRNLLVEGARLAGLSAPRLIPEPVAAASYFTAVLGTAVPVGRSVAIYDLGGGTFDATVVRRTPAGFDVLAEEGLSDVGGLDFDHAVVEFLGRAYQDNPAWARLTNPVDSGDRRNRRLLYDDVCAAKERLSRTASADIPLPTLDVDAHITREEMEGLIRTQLEATVACLGRTIANARQRPQDLVAIFLVGGSSRIPLAAHLIHTELGVAPTTLDQPETVVAEGAMAIGAATQPGARPGMPGRPGAPTAPAASPVSGDPGYAQARPSGPPAAAGQPARPVSGPPVSAPPLSRPPARPISGPPISARPVSGPPVSAPPVSGPPGRPVSGRPVQPHPMQPRPPQAQPRPLPAPGPQVAPPHHAAQHPAQQHQAAPRGVPAMPAAGGRQPFRGPVQASPPLPDVGPRPAHQPGKRPWYTEPVAIATGVVLVLVVLACVVLVSVSKG